MSRRGRAVMVALLCAVFCHAAPARSQPPPPPLAAPPLPAPPAPAAEQAGATDGAGESRSGSRDDVVRVASDYALPAGDSVRDLVVVMGNVTVDGHVRRDLVVVLGEAQLGPDAVVDGDLAVIG